jgi:hypothetical protein
MPASASTTFTDEKPNTIKAVATMFLRMVFISVLSLTSANEVFDAYHQNQPATKEVGWIFLIRHFFHAWLIIYPGDPRKISDHSGLAPAVRPYRFHWLAAYP